MDTWSVHTWGAHSPVAANASAGSLPFSLGEVTGAARPREAGRAIGSTITSPFELLSDGRVSEADLLRVVGRPSMRIYRAGSGATVVSVTRNLSNAGAMSEADLAWVNDWGGAVLDYLRAMSRGPLQSRDLRRLNHPFGYDASWGKGDKNFIPRALPARYKGQSLRHVRGVRGAVPSLAVVNSQSGKFARSWSFEWHRTPRGLEARFVNTAPHAWFLAHGTLKMQPHGPFTRGPLLHLRALDAQLQRTIAGVRRRQNAERVIETLVSAAP